jgi:NitT/TauT family transport system substrate-binding protein
MSQRLSTALLCICAGISLLSCSSRNREPAAGKPEQTTLKVVVLPFLSFAPFFIAQEEGYFAAENLDVEFIRLPRNPQAIPALAHGDLDVASSVTSVTLLSAIGRGAQIRFVAGKGHIDPDGCTSNAIMAPRKLVEDGELDEVSAVRGRRVDLNRVLLEAYHFDRLLAATDLGLDDIEIVDVPPPAESEALTSGAIDLTVSTEPDVTRLLQSGKAVVWSAAQEVIPGFQHASLLFGPSLLVDDVDAGRRFMVAYLRGVRAFHRGKTDRNIEILATHTGLQRDLLREACWPAIRRDGRVNVDSVLEFQRWAVELELLDRPVERNEIWDRSFVDHANRRLAQENLE